MSIEQEAALLAATWRRQAYVVEATEVQKSNLRKEAAALSQSNITLTDEKDRLVGENNRYRSENKNLLMTNKRQQDDHQNDSEIIDSKTEELRKLQDELTSMQDVKVIACNDLKAARKENRSLREHSESLQSLLDEQSQLLTANETRIDSLQSHLTAAIHVQQEENSHLLETIQEKMAFITSLGTENDVLTTTAAEAGKEAHLCQRKVEKVESRLRETQQNLASANARISSAIAEAESEKCQRARLDVLVEQHCNRINLLEKNLNRREQDIKELNEEKESLSRDAKRRLQKLLSARQVSHQCVIDNLKKDLNANHREIMSLRVAKLGLYQDLQKERIGKSHQISIIAAECGLSPIPPLVNGLDGASFALSDEQRYFCEDRMDNTGLEHVRGPAAAEWKINKVTETSGSASDLAKLQQKIVFEIAKQRSHITKLEQKINTLEVKNRRLTKQVERHQTEAATAVQHAENLDTDLQRCRAEFHNSQAELQRHKADLEDCCYDYLNAKHDLLVREEELTQAEQTNRDLEAANGELEQNLDYRYAQEMKYKSASADLTLTTLAPEQLNLQKLREFNLDDPGLRSDVATHLFAYFLDRPVIKAMLENEFLWAGLKEGATGTRFVKEEKSASDGGLGVE